MLKLKRYLTVYLEEGRYVEAEKILNGILTETTDSDQDVINATLKLLNLLKCPISIIPFEGSDKELVESTYSILVSELAHSGMLIIVERDRIEDIISETKLSLSDLIDNSHVNTSIGSLLGSQYIITGYVNSDGNRISLSSCLISVESGRIIDGWNLEGTSDKYHYYVRQLAATIHKSITGKDIPNQTLFDNLQGNLGLEPLEGVRIMIGLDKEGISPVYKNRETITIYYMVNSENPAGRYYVTIMSIGPEGEVNLLFPSNFNPNNLVATN